MILSNQRNQCSADSCKTWQGEPMNSILSQKSVADQYISGKPNVSNFRAFKIPCVCAALGEYHV